MARKKQPQPSTRPDAEEYLHLVNEAVKRVYASVIPKRRIRKSELVSAGNLALVQAANSYPSSRACQRGISFVPYARIIIYRLVQREAMYLYGQCSAHGHVDHGARIEPNAGERVDRLMSRSTTQDSREEYARFLRIARGLSRLQKMILYRHFYRGAKLRDVARELGIGQVKCVLEFATGKQRIRENAVCA
jgi:DNA-directed RNA polymerase specialized sigma subunit